MHPSNPRKYPMNSTLVHSKYQDMNKVTIITNIVIIAANSNLIIVIISPINK